MTDIGIAPAPVILHKPAPPKLTNVTEWASASIDAFMSLSYESQSVEWMGRHVHKLPSDMMLYQELIYRNRPDVLIETGTYMGGSAYFFATLMDLLGHGRVISVDIASQPVPSHPRIEYRQGDSADVGASLAGELVGQTVMVSLDSDHHKPHVLRELAVYAPMVTPGQYLVVEDTCVNGHPIMPGYGDGPWEALQEWQPEQHGFKERDVRRAFLMTYHAWLEKV